MSRLSLSQIQDALSDSQALEIELESDQLDREHREFYADDWRDELEPEHELPLDWFEPHYYDDAYYFDEPFFHEDDYA